MKLPIVSGSNLERQKMTFPADFNSPLNLVFIAFKRWHQDDVDGWVPFVQQLRQEYSDLEYYEFPTLPESNFLYRTFLNEGMRAGIPNKATRRRTITLYLNKATFRKALDIPNEGNIWLYLFTQSGQVLWRVEGSFTLEKGEALRTAVMNQPPDN